LKERRVEAYSLFKQNMYKSRELQNIIIENIETGQNYRFASLLKYITALGLKLYANNTHIQDAVDLGLSIKKYRTERQLTQFQIMKSCNFNPSKLNRLEKGQCSRKSLDKWLYVYPDFDLYIRE